jgi:hypothetical protein
MVYWIKIFGLFLVLSHTAFAQNLYYLGAIKQAIKVTQDALELSQDLNSENPGKFVYDIQDARQQIANRPSPAAPNPPVFPGDDILNSQLFESNHAKIETYETERQEWRDSTLQERDELRDNLEQVENLQQIWSDERLPYVGTFAYGELFIIDQDDINKELGSLKTEIESRLKSLENVLQEDNQSYEATLNVKATLEWLGTDPDFRAGNLNVDGTKIEEAKEATKDKVQQALQEQADKEEAESQARKEQQEAERLALEQQQKQQAEEEKRQSEQADEELEEIKKSLLDLSKSYIFDSTEDPSRYGTTALCANDDYGEMYQRCMQFLEFKCQGFSPGECPIQAITMENDSGEMEIVGAFNSTNPNYQVFGDMNTMFITDQGVSLGIGENQFVCPKDATGNLAPLCDIYTETPEGREKVGIIFSEAVPLTQFPDVQIFYNNLWQGTTALPSMDQIQESIEEFIKNNPSY